MTVTVLPARPSSPAHAGATPDAVALERMLRRTLVHDPRSAAPRFGHMSVREIVAEAIRSAWADEAGRPASVSRESWLRKRALEILEAALEREAIAAQVSRAPLVDGAALRAREVLSDAEERARWQSLAAEGTPLARIELAILRLPEVRRRVVSHRILDGLTTDEVAWLLDMTGDEVDVECEAAVRGLRLELS